MPVDLMDKKHKNQHSTAASSSNNTMCSDHQVIRVMHVDDETNLLTTTKQILELQNPFQVETASSVKEATQKIKEKKFDAVISDYQMPEKNGLTFLKELRENGDNIPFILFTGKGREEVAIKALNLGADYYINKIGHPETVYPQLSHSILQAVQRKKAETRLRYKVQFESVIARISSCFVNPIDLDSAIDESLADIGSVSGASRVYIYLKQKNGNLLDNRHEWYVESIKPQIEKLQTLPIEVISLWMEQLRNDKTIQITDVSLLSPQAKEIKKILEKRNIRSIIVLPITVSGELAGFIGLDNIENVSIWNSDDVTLLQIVSELIGSSLERKITDEKLKESEKTYRLLTENITDAIFIQDMNLKVTYVSPSIEALSGYTPEEVYNLKTEDFMTPESFERGVNDFRELLSLASKSQDTKIPLKQYEYIRKDGSKFWGELKTKLLRDCRGNPVGIQGTLRDITDRKKTEEKLKESERVHRLITENTTDVIFIQNLDLSIQYVSPSVKVLAGYTPEEVMKLGPKPLMTPESYEQGIKNFKEDLLVATKNPDADLPFRRYEYVRKDGSTGWGEFKPKILRNSEGTIIGMQGTLRDITERKKTEDAFHQERETLELVTGNMNTGLTIISRDFKILWINKFLKKKFGNVIGKTCFTTYNDRASVCPGCGVKEIFESGKDNVVHEQSVPAANGLRKWVELTANPIRDEKGNIVAASELAVYLNNRKEIEKKLREAEKRYRALFDKAPLGILIIDSDGTAVEFNHEAHRQLGYSREEFRKLTVSDYENLETSEEINARMKKILEEGKDEFETKHRTKTGEIRDIVNTVQVIQLNGKKFFHVITRDVTEYKKAEKMLQEKEEKYRELINGMNDTAWVINLDDCKFIDVNDAAVNVLGYSREELLSMRPQDIDDSLSSEDIEFLIKNMPKDEIQVFETTHTTKNGRTIPVEISSSIITYNGKQAILSIARNITERKKAEKKLNKTMKELVMMNEKLGVIGKLTRHDTRNKLAIIANNTYLAKRQLASDHKLSQYFEPIESAIDQIDKIFSFARIYEQIGAEDLTYIDVKKCIDEAGFLFSEIDKVKLVNDCNGLTLLTDSLLRQLFYNLIDDSLKHGETVNKIRVYYEKEDDKLKLVYADNGTGIPENEKEKIFKEGYGKGTGYGLYLIRKLCDVYGWTIKETGKYGKGAQFTITIPKTNENKKKNYKIT